MLQYAGGRMVPVPFTDGIQWRTRAEYLQALEDDRRALVRLLRSYYAGSQYDARNAACRADMLASTDASAEEKALVRLLAFWDETLPEHLRLHEYSTQIQESVDFVANRLADSARIVLDDPTADRVVQAALDASPKLAGSPDDDEITLVNVFREAVKVGDVPVLVRWRDDTCWLEFWDSEVVEMRFTDDHADLVEVVVEQVDWLVPPGSSTGEEEPVTVRRVWRVVERPTVGEVPLDVVERQLADDTLATVPEGGPGVRLECAELVYLVRSDGVEHLRTVWWGAPFLPWWLLRGDQKALSADRGESLITNQTMKSADRYNAVQQHAWKTVVYNSHSNIVLTGDALMVESQHRVVRKDVADVLTFPGATNATVLSLPTQPDLIVQQTETLKDSMYGSMGVTRVDQTSLQGLGGVTGYALEILDQKSVGTFSRIRQTLVRDLKTLVNLVLNCYAYWSQAGSTVGEDAPVNEQPTSYVNVDPTSLFPNRKTEVRMGTGHVVDDARIRDDFTARLISLEEALRQKGMGDEDIRLILSELQGAAERSAAAQRVAFGETGTEGTTSTQAGRRFATTNRPEPVDEESA